MQRQRQTVELLLLEGILFCHRLSDLVFSWTDCSSWVLQTACTILKQQTDCSEAVILFQEKRKTLFYDNIRKCTVADYHFFFSG